MDFPISDLMDQAACYARLDDWLHPDGLPLLQGAPWYGRPPPPSRPGALLPLQYL
jgi:hypothetical protein